MNKQERIAGILETMIDKDKSECRNYYAWADVILKALDQPEEIEEIRINAIINPHELAEKINELVRVIKKIK